MLCDLKWFEVACDEWCLSETGAPIGRVVFKGKLWRSYLGSCSNGLNFQAKSHPSRDAAMRALEAEATGKVVAMLSEDARRVLGQAGLL